MSTQVLFRRAVAADIPSLVELLGLLFSIEADFIQNTARQRRGLELLLDEERAVVMVAEAGGQVVGCCTGQVLVSTAEGGLSAVLEDVVVQPGWQRQGIGRRLVNRVGQWAARQGARRVQLLADRNNVPGLTFYRQLGWQMTDLICLRTFVRED